MPPAASRCQARRYRRQLFGGVAGVANQVPCARPCSPSAPASAADRGQPMFGIGRRVPRPDHHRRVPPSANSRSRATASRASPRQAKPSCRLAGDRHRRLAGNTDRASNTIQPLGACCCPSRTSFYLSGQRAILLGPPRAWLPCGETICAPVSQQASIGDQQPARLPLRSERRRAHREATG